MSFYDCERKFPYFFAYNYFVGSPGKLRANVHDFIETKGLKQGDIPTLKNKVFNLLKNDLEATICQS
jgi:1-acyl-sn-glycerol-3-phosphate acyltransferase